MNVNSIFLVVLIAVLLSGCDHSLKGRNERRNLETSIYFDLIKINIEHSSTLNDLIESGEIDKAHEMIKMGIFLDLNQLDRLVSDDYQAMLGDAVPSTPLEDLKSELGLLYEEYFTEGVKKAGERHASLPSDLKPILESREFLRKMERLGLPKNEP